MMNLARQYPVQTVYNIEILRNFIRRKLPRPHPKLKQSITTYSALKKGKRKKKTF